jgi:hypothetical protein
LPEYFTSLRSCCDVGLLHGRLLFHLPAPCSLLRALFLEIMACSPM